MAACKIVIVGQMKVSEVEKKLHAALGVKVKIETPRKSAPQNVTFKSIGGTGSLDPLVIQNRSKKLKTLQAEFSRKYGSDLRLVFPDPDRTTNGNKYKEARGSLTLKQLQDKYMTENQRKWFETLESSPMFHFSLASKELFHSNFIAWLGKDEPELFKKLIKKWIKWRGRGGIDQIVNIKRENRNLDISIEFIKSNSTNAEKPSLLVIENKVKSIPTSEQLEEYSSEKLKRSKYADTSFVLLTFSPLSDMPDNWPTCLYGIYIAWLRENLSIVKSSYNRQLIKDYCDFTNAFYNLFRSVAENDTYSINSELYLKAKELRIHDLLAKHQANQLASKLKKLSEQKFGSMFSIKFTNRGGGKEEADISIERNFLRGTPICSVFFNFSKDIFAGVQLDADDLRLAVKAPETMAEKLTNAFWDNNWWGTDARRSFFEKPKNQHKNRRNGSGYFEYKDKDKLFLYKAHKKFLKHEALAVDEVAKIMLEYFSKMIENKDAIEAYLDKLANEPNNQ